MAAATVTTESAQATCLDVTPFNDPGCHGNVTWAMQTGIYEYPMWYTEYPALSMFASFKDFQNVLAQKVGPGNGTRAGQGWDCPFPCNYNVPTCFDILPSSPGQCYQNVLWAKNTGVALRPEWYSEFPGLTVNSSLSDFQYVLHTKLRTGNGTGWQCPQPCTSTFLVSSTPAAPTFMATSVTTSSTITFTTTTTIASSSGFPWWCWLLLLLLLGLCFVVVAASRAYFARKGKQGPKKARATPAEMAPLTHQTLDPQSVQFTPVLAAQPTRDYAVPVYPVAVAPVAHTLFDQIDTNRDGVITRDEYARATLFDRLDTNHDGVLTRDELARLRQ